MLLWGRLNKWVYYHHYSFVGDITSGLYYYHYSCLSLLYALAIGDFYLTMIFYLVNRSRYFLVHVILHTCCMAATRQNIDTVQITFIFIGQTRLVFGKRVCTCVMKHSNAFRTFLNWLKNSKRVLHEPKLHISRLPLFANFDL